MTKKDRAQVVELLRCAADVCSLRGADVVPRRGTNEYLTAAELDRVRRIMEMTPGFAEGRTP